MKIVVFRYDAALLPFYPSVTRIAAAPDGASCAADRWLKIQKKLTVHRASERP